MDRITVHLVHVQRTVIAPEEFRPLVMPQEPPCAWFDETGKKFAMFF